MVTPVVAPYVPSYAARPPYLTAQEFAVSPNGVDTSQLVPGGNAAVNAAALKAVILGASGWVDAICHQILAATLDTQVGIYRVRSDGTVWVPCDYTPIITVNAVSWGYSPGAMAAMTDLSNVWPQRKVVQIPLTGNPAFGFDSGFRARTVYVTVSYVNGYANTLLLGGVNAGDLVLDVVSPLGVVPGLTLSINDSAVTEDVVVAPSYVLGSTVVPLVAPLAFGHVDATAITTLPPRVKEACAHLTSALIKTRGAEAVVMSSMSEQPTTKELIQSGGLADVEVATALLGDFIRVR